MKFHLLFLTLAALLLSSCATTTKGAQSAPVLARYVELDPIKADIKVDESHRVVGEGHVAYLFGFRVGGRNQKYAEGIVYSTETGGIFSFLNKGKNDARAAAAYNALQQASTEADLLVHPKYEVTVRSTPLGLIWRRYDVKVSGYAATYTNFHTEKQKVVIINNEKEYVFPDND